MNFIGSGRGNASRSPTWATNGMVCCSQPLAAGAGIEMLKAGGSAVDAAIATNACLGLMEPTACGLGGDLFAILWDPKESKLAGLNASGRAPLASASEKIPPDVGRHDPAVLAVLVVDTRRGRRLVRAARALRALAAGTGAGSRDSVRRGRLPAFAGDRQRVVLGIGAAQGEARIRRRLYAGWGRSERWRDLSKSRAWPDAERRCEARSRIYSDRKVRRGHRRVFESQRRVLRHGRLRRERTNLGRPGEYKLPRLRRLGTAAEHPGHRGPADAEHAGGLRPRRHGPRVG